MSEKEIHESLAKIRTGKGSGTMNKRRTNLTDSLRDQVWARDKGICQRCKVALLDEYNYYEEAVEELAETKEMPIYRWKHECWSCHKETDMVSYDVVFLFDHSIGDINKLDKILMEKYPFVKERYSKMQHRMVIANMCIHCGIMQGNFFVTDQLLEKYNKVGNETLIDMKIPNILTPEDIPVEKSDEFVMLEKNDNVGHIHHIDCNCENNDLTNLILLCRTCHFKTHAELRKKQLEKEKYEGK